MRILFVSNIFPPHVRGGYELGCQAIAREMQARGHEVCIATSIAPGYLSNAGVDETLRIESCFEPVFCYESHLIDTLSHAIGWQRYQQRAFGGIIPGNALALARLLRDYKPDVTWIFNPLGLGPIGIFEAALTWPARCIVHLMDDIDGMIRHYSYPTFSHARFSRLKKYFTAISCSFKIMAVNELFGPYRHHRVIYNGVDFKRLASEARLANSSLLPTASSSKSTRLVYFGQVEAAKGLVYLVEGASEARKRGAQFQIDIIGRGSRSFHDQLEAAIRAAGLQEVIALIGFVAQADLFGALKNYDGAILLLSDYEAFAYAAVEAIGCGLPVVLTRDVGSAECFPSDYPLFVTDRSSRAEVADKIVWLCNSRSVAAKLATSTRDHLMKHCDLEVVTLPSYIRTIRSCPINENRFAVDALLSSLQTTEFYSFTQ